MSVIVLLIVAGGSVAAGFLGAFVWAVRSGQFDDTCTPAIRILFEESGDGGPSAGDQFTGGRLPAEETPATSRVR